jgi:hypothetical protein
MKGHHPVVRRYGHASLLWNIPADSLITESLDENPCMLMILIFCLGFYALVTLLFHGSKKFNYQMETLYMF